MPSGHRSSGLGSYPSRPTGTGEGGGSGIYTGPATLHPDVRSRVAARLAAAQDLLGALQREIEDEDADSLRVLRELGALRALLTGAKEVILRSHLRNHVSHSGSGSEAGSDVDDLIDALRGRRW